MATLVGIRCVQSGILARNVLSSRILSSVNRTASRAAGLTQEKLKKIQRRIEGEIESFTAARKQLEFLAEDYSPHIVFEDGYAGDKIKGIFHYQLRLTKYHTLVHFRSAGTIRTIESSEIDTVNKAIIVAWNIVLAPGWSFVFFFGLFGWVPVVFKKIIKPKTRPHAGSNVNPSDSMQHFFTSKFFIDEKGRITRHILTLRKTLINPETIKKT